ncbi:MAG: hypothetical protein KGL35_14285 [Bradyrhizobium sp.]|nr:hypothetical protein [Bradyrhizobium sp.]
MAGVAGSTFLDEINRLANGGTYPAKSAYLSAQGAANIWAATSGLGLLGALNVKAGTTGMGMNAVCNVLGGTTNASQVDALRSRAS